MKLLDDIKSFCGNVVLIGVQNKNILAECNKNKDAAIFTINPVKRGNILTSRKKGKTDKGMKVNIKKLHKTFKKKSIDTLVYDMDEMYQYFKYFIGESIIISKGNIYIYGTSRYIDPKVLVNRYKRYNTKAFLELDGDNFTIVIDAKNGKTNWFKNRFYLVVDTLHNIGDMISVALIS